MEPAGLEHVSSRHTHSIQKAPVPSRLVPPSPHFQVSALSSKEGLKASNGGFGSEVGALGGGRGRDAKNGEPLQERERGREGAGRWKPGGHPPELQAAKGQQAGEAARGPPREDEP